VQKYNKSSTADVTRFLSTLHQLYSSIIPKIITPNSRIDILTDDFENYLDPNPYLGFCFKNACVKANIQGQNKADLKSRLVTFLKRIKKPAL
jgi:hypothetical protein